MNLEELCWKKEVFSLYEKDKNKRRINNIYPPTPEIIRKPSIFG